MKKNCVTVISARFNESMEQWILDDMIQSTMLPYFAWQSDHNSDVQFERTFSNPDYYGRVTVVANFKNSVDHAFFITSFSDQ